jgi:hypothetical protein
MKTIKKKSWWTYPQGGGEPCKHCVFMFCACLNVFVTLLLSALIEIDNFVHALC